jgi:sugar lactone lactonase YvrE
VLTGVVDGRVLRLHPDDGSVVVVADTGGRPLGLEWLPDGMLLVCDARRGLLAVDPDDGGIEVLVSEVAGQSLGFCNNAAVAADGAIWFIPRRGSASTPGRPTSSSTAELAACFAVIPPETQRSSLTACISPME